MFPVLSHQFVLYLQHVATESHSKSAVEEAVQAISWVQQIAGYNSIGQDTIVKVVLSGLQRDLAKPKVKKEPVTLDMLRKMAETAGTAPSLTDSRLLAIVLLAFAAFLRFSEIAKLRCNDIVFHPGHMVVKISSSKTDQYRDGAEVPVVRSGTMSCPVMRLEQYYQTAGISQLDSGFLFRAIIHTKKGERLRESGSISYTRLRELVRDKIKALGYDPSLFGTHSFRAGGATLAANEGVPDRMFKRHGRWKSESAKDGYIKDSLEKRLSVSKGLNL